MLLVVFAVLPQLDLRQHLVGERVGHDETRVARGATEVNKSAFGQENDALAIREDDVINLWLDVFPLVLVQVGDIDFVVEVADVADDCLVFHASPFVGPRRHGSCRLR